MCLRATDSANAKHSSSQVSAMSAKLLFAPKATASSTGLFPRLCSRGPGISGCGHAGEKALETRLQPKHYAEYPHGCFGGYGGGAYG